jgi:hypothetical protein
MKVYRICSQLKSDVREYVAEKGAAISLNSAYEEFKNQYGLKNVERTERKTPRFFSMLANARISLYKDKRRLKLNANPLIDDFCTLFAEWLGKKPGFMRVVAQELPRNVSVEDFSFPL